MKLRPSSIVLLIVALILAAGTAMVARNLMRPPAPPKEVVTKEPPKPATTHVLVAAAAIAPGDFVDSRVLKWVEKLEEDVQAGDIAAQSVGSRREEEQRLLGSTVRRVIEAGESVVDNALLSPGSPGFLSAVLSPGKRAMSIPISVVTSNAGLVSAGDWVDVILSVEHDEAQFIASANPLGGIAQANLAAQTILRQARVLALNSDTESLVPASVAAGDEEAASSKKDRKKAQRKNKVYKTITLEVSPQEAERLAVAREAGSLQVVLRSIRDVDEAGVDVAEGGRKGVTRLKDVTSVFKTHDTMAATYFGGQKPRLIRFEKTGRHQ